MRYSAVLGILVVLAAPLAAQTAAEIRAAAESITAQAIARHVGVIAHDTMLGRDTPSRGLEMTARYVADQFERLGLKPYGDDGTWFHHYRIPEAKPSDTAATALNTVGILEGSDPQLKQEYVILSAHMDHLGLSSGQIDSINNGANDNASGVAGLIELARAFSQPGTRPKRSLVFLAPSGGARGMWGSEAFAMQIRDQASGGKGRVGASGQNQNILKSLAAAIKTAYARANTAATSAAVANLNLDGIGGGIGDSIMVNGTREVVVTPPTWIAAAHPDLGLTVVEGGTVVSPESDHFPFARRGIPSLYFHRGSLNHDRAAPDSLDVVNVEAAARVLRLVFYVGREIANADKRPGWTPEGRRQFLAPPPE